MHGIAEVDDNNSFASAAARRWRRNEPRDRTRTASQRQLQRTWRARYQRVGRMLDRGRRASLPRAARCCIRAGKPAALEHDAAHNEWSLDGTYKYHLAFLTHSVELVENNQVELERHKASCNRLSLTIVRGFSCRSMHIKFMPHYVMPLPCHASLL